MSLQVWLPLNGDLHNQGLSNYDISIMRGSAVFNQNGKIGQCFYANGVNTIQIKNIISDIYNYSGYSLCAWFYIEAQNTSHSGSGIISAGDWNNQILNLALSRWSSDHYTQLQVSGPRWNKTYNFNFNKNTWYHAVVCSDGIKTYAYVNGELIGDTLPGFLPTSIVGNDVAIGGATYYNGMQFFGKINDVRIYDHCLSAKEVEEISKGLILHYKLDNDGFGNENYWGNGKPLRDNSLSGELKTVYGTSPHAYASEPSFIPNEYIETKFLSTRTQVDNGTIQLQKLQRYNATYNNMCPILEHLKTGEQLTISYELYITSPIKVTFALTKILDGTSTTVRPNINLIQISDLNVWTKVSQSIEIPSSFDESNITTESILGIMIAFYDILGTTSSDEVIIRVKNIKLEKGQVATNWTPARVDFGHSSDNVIHDSSGYNNNGIIEGNEFESSSDSAKYSHSISLLNNNWIRVINRPTIVCSHDVITVNIWAKIATSWSYNKGALISCQEDGGWAIGKNSSNILYFEIYADGAYRVAKAPDNTYLTSILNGWHMFTGTADNSTINFYIDGELIGTGENAATTEFSYANNYIFIGGEAKWNTTTPYSTINGLFGDTRIYATALTPHQIKELYQTSTTIDKNGNIYTREYIENNANININKNGQLQSNKIVDSNDITIANFKKSDKSINGNTIYEY